MDDFSDTPSGVERSSGQEAERAEVSEPALPVESVGQAAEERASGVPATAGPISLEDAAVSLPPAAPIVAEPTVQDLLLQIEAERQRAEALAREAQQLAARLDATLDALANGVVLYGPDGTVARMNAAASSLLRYSTKDLARPFVEREDYVDFVQPDGHIADLDETPGARALRGETVRGQLFTLRFPDTGLPPVAVSVSAAPVTAGHDRSLGAVVSFTDITELSQTQDQLRSANEELAAQAEELEVQAEELRMQNEELARLALQLELERGRLEAVLQQMPGGVVIAEAPSGQTVLANAQVEEILRGPFHPAAGPEEYMQYEAFYPDGRPWPADEAPLTRSLCTGEIVTNEEMHVIRGDGSRAVVLVSSRPVRDRQGRIVAGVVTFSDITGRKEMEEALRQAHDKLEMRVAERTAELAQANETLKYQAYLLANVNDAVVATDGAFRVTAWNRGAEELYGWTAEEAMGRPFAELVPSTVIGLDNEAALHTIITTGRLQAELAQKRRDGSSIITEVRVMALPDQDGAVDGFVAVSRDVTRRKHMEEELRTSEEMLRQLAENVHEVFWITDGERRKMLYVNPAYEQIWGRSRQSLYEQPASFLDAVHPADRGRVAAGREVVAESGFDQRYRIVRADGEVRWIWARAFPIQNPLGEVYRIAGVAEDITEQVESYQILEQRVEERTRELSTLLAISHQMASVLQLKLLLPLILDQLQNIVTYTDAAIYKLEGDEVTIVEYRGPLPRDQALGMRFTIKGTVGLETVAARGKPVIIPDIQGDSPLAVAWRAAKHEPQQQLVGNCRSWMAVPLIVQDRVIGLLRLDHREPDRFSAHHADLALAFASHAAIAMENARLYEQLETLAAAEERQRLARELHDAVSQMLFSASLTADVLPRLWQQDPIKGKQSLEELQQLTRGALAEMRSLLLELRPAALLEVDMPVLLRGLADAAAGRLGIPVSVIVEGSCATGPCALAPDIQVGLYRIAQEALNNVVKHAQPGTLTVRFECGPEMAPGRAPADGSECGPVRLAIVDDGRGFDPQQVAGGSFGLDIMRERAKAIGASLSVDSGPGRGTRVEVVCPAP